jgi:hypothetical protein
MNPEQTPTPPPTTPSKNPARQKVALLLLIGPTALIIGSIILSIVVGFMFTNVMIVRSITNVVVFLAGLITFLTWLPGIIIGIILLTTKGKNANN